MLDRLVRSIVAGATAFTVVLSVAPASRASDASPAWTTTIQGDRAVGTLIAGVPGGFVVGGRADGTVADQTNLGYSDVFVQRYSTAGTLIWSLQFGTVAADDIWAIDAGPDAVYVGGQTFGQFGTNTYSSASQPFVAKVSLDGTFIWARQWAAKNIEAVAATPDGSVVATGWTHDILANGVPGVSYAYVKTYRGDGTVAWTDTLIPHNAVGNVWAGGKDIAVDASGITVAGEVDGSIEPNGTRYRRDVWLRRYDLAGHVQWTKQFNYSAINANGDTQEVTTVVWAVAAGGNVIYVMGNSSFPLSGSGAWSNQAAPYLRAFDLAGNVLWTQDAPAVRGVADAAGLLEVETLKSATLYPSARVVRVTPTGARAVLYEQLGDRSPGGWTYDDVTASGGVVVVSRDHTLYDPDYADTFDLIGLDTGPSGAININGGAGFATTSNVTLQTPASSAASTVVSVALSNTGADGSWTTRPYAPTQPWALAGGDGMKTVYAKWQDATGAWAPVVSDTITLDRVAPGVSAPLAGLTAGSAIANGNVPIAVTSTAADAVSKLATYWVAQKIDAGAQNTFGTIAMNGAATATKTTMRQAATGHSDTFFVRAQDRAGNASAWVSSPLVKPQAWQEGRADVTYGGAWAWSTNAAFWYGSAKTTVAAGATSTVTITGRSVGWVSRTGPDRGKADVYVDGVYAQTVDLYAAAVGWQRIVWARNFPGVGTHTVQIRTKATAGRPRVDVDAFVFLQ